MEKKKKNPNSTLISRSYIVESSQIEELLGLKGKLNEVCLYEGLSFKDKEQGLTDKTFQFLTLEEK